MSENGDQPEQLTGNELRYSVDNGINEDDMDGTHDGEVYESRSERTKKTSSPLSSPTSKPPPLSIAAPTDDKSDSKRKFRIVGLRHPGEWRTNDKLRYLMDKCLNFHIWFDPPKKGIKMGGISLSYDTIETARLAFSEAKKIQIDGQLAKLQASRAFYEPYTAKPLPQFTLPDDPSILERTLFVVNLTEAFSNETILQSVLGESAIESLTFLPQIDKLNQAQVRMKTRENAEGAKEDADGFEQDSDKKKTIRVMWGEEYTEWVAASARPQSFLPSPHPSSAHNNLSASQLSPPTTVPPSSVRNASTDEMLSPRSVNCTTQHPLAQHQARMASGKDRPLNIKQKPQQHFAPLPTVIRDNEPEPEELVEDIDAIVEQEKLNWAEIELEHVGELYQLIDKVSLKHGGLRDALLKDALLLVLERTRSESIDWMRKHLEDLIKVWKGEIKKEGLVDRPTRVPLQAPSIAVVPIEEKKKRNKKSAAVLRTQFGIGAVLASARIKFATEEGELDVEEDDKGNTLIGGEELSFDMWAKFNKQPLKRPAPSMREKNEKKEKEKEEERVANRKAKRAQKEEEKKKRKEEEDASKPPKELEEGEMESDEEKTTSKGISYSSTSSSSSDSDDDIHDSRRRRKLRRKADKNSGPTLPPLFQDLFDNRVAIISQLAMEHKVAFTQILSQIVSKKSGFSAADQNKMMSYVSQNFG